MDSLTTVLVHDEDYQWHLSEVPKQDSCACGKPLLLVETADRAIGFAGHPQAIANFASSLQSALTANTLAMLTKRLTGRQKTE